MKKFLALTAMLFCSIGFADTKSFATSVKSIVSVDSHYTPTSPEKHNFRYRAVFNQDVHNEVPGSLSIEKIKLPSGVGSPYEISWIHKIDLTKIKATEKSYKSLPFESALGCCDYGGLAWDGYRLKFNVTIGNKKFDCLTSDVSKGTPSTDCK